MAGKKHDKTLQSIRQQRSRIPSGNPDGSLYQRNAAASIHLRSNAGRHISLPAGAPMTTECVILGLSYWLFAVLGFVACVPSITYGYFGMYKTNDAPFIPGCFAITFAILGFCMMVIGTAPYLPCINVVMFP
jgi:hypothetical protein